MRALDAIAIDVEQVAELVVYKIRPGPYSMFGPYSKAHFGRRANKWVLQLALSRILLVPFVPFVLGLVTFRILGPITFADVGIIIGIPVVMVSIAIVESQVRLRRWWALL